MVCGSDVGEDKIDPEPIPGCAPSVCGMDGSTIVDEKEGPTLDKSQTPVVNGVDVLLNPRGVPKMVETMALANDMVVLTLTTTLESWVVCGVTISKFCVGLKIFAVKDTREAVVEFGPSMYKGGGAIPKVGLFGSKYGKVGGDSLCLFGEGNGKGV